MMSKEDKDPGEERVWITRRELETIAEGVDTVNTGPYGRAWDVIDVVRKRFERLKADDVDG